MVGVKGRRAFASWFYILLVFTVGLLCYGGWRSSGQEVSVINEAAIPLEGVWQYQLPTGETGEITLPAKLPVQTGEIFSISQQLSTEYIEGETLRIRSSQQAIRVLIDGREVYTYGQEQPLSFLKGPGSLYHFVRVGQNNAGAMVTVELSSVYPQYAGFANEIFMGSKSALIFDVVQRYWVSFMLSVLIGLVGLLLIGAYIFFRKKVAITAGALYMGWEALLVAIWSATECKLIELILPNPTVVYLMTFLSLVLIPIPMVLFLRVNYSAYISEKNYTILGNVLVGLALLYIGLQLTGIMDFMEALLLTHLAIALACMALVMVVVKDSRRQGRLSNLGKGLLLLVLFASIDLVRFYEGSYYHDSAAAMRVGMLLFMLLMCYDVSIHMYRMIRRGMEAKTLMQAAYIDVLTKCGNRAAFEKIMEQIDLAHGEYPALELIMVDVNHFKQINDNYGHQSGDEVLRNVGSCLQEAFEGCADCYRVGGDEFVVLAPKGFDRLEQRIRFLEQLLAKNNGQHEISISYGKAAYRDQQQDIWALYREADQKMYEYKRQMAKHGQQR